MLSGVKLSVNAYMKLEDIQLTRDGDQRSIEGVLAHIDLYCEKGTNYTLVYSP